MLEMLETLETLETLGVIVYSIPVCSLYTSLLYGNSYKGKIGPFPVDEPVYCIRDTTYTRLRLYESPLIRVSSPPLNCEIKILFRFIVLKYQWPVL